MNRRIRVAVGTAGALAVLAAVEVLLYRAAAAQWQVVQTPGPASLAEALTLVIVAVAALLGSWLTATTVAALLAHLPGRLGDAAERWARAWAPAVSRRVATVLVGAVMGGALAPGTALGDGPAAPSAASPGVRSGFTTTSKNPVSGHVGAEEGAGANAGLTIGVGERSPGFALTRPAPAPGWTPSRPLQRALPSSGLVTSGSASDRAADVVVHRGDTLWDIARRHLGPDATEAEVANAWPAWHEANRAVIGDDPDLILPGQILRPPHPAGWLAAQPSRAAR